MNTLPHYYGKRNFYFESQSWIYLIPTVTHEFKKTNFIFMLETTRSNIITDDFIYAHLLLLQSHFNKFMHPIVKSISVLNKNIKLSEYKVTNYKRLQKVPTSITDYKIHGDYNIVKNLLNTRTELEKTLEIFLSFSYYFSIIQEKLICDTWKLGLEHLKQY